MKKLLAVCLLAALLCGCASSMSSAVSSPTLTADDLVGKTLDELTGVLNWDHEFLAYGHGFAKDKLGNPVYFRWELTEEEQFLITAAEIFPARDTDNSPESFDALQEGMTLGEVIAKIGAPSSIPATGVFYIAFTDSLDNEYWLAWQDDPLTLSWIIQHDAE